MPRLILITLAGLALPCALAAQPPTSSSTPTYRLTQAYVHELANQNSLRFELPVKIQGRTNSVHSAADDCEMHLAGSSGVKIGFPGKVVVEPPNLCAFAPPAALGTSWGNVFDNHVLNLDCTAVGFPRLYAEHLANGTSPANPPHMVEIHPAITLRCGADTIDFSSFLTIVPDMAAIQESSTEQCLSGYQLWVRRNATKQEYEFFERRPNRCGNFAVLSAVVDPRYVRSISGGHASIAQVSTSQAGPFPLKLYSYDGTPEDATIAQIGNSNNEEPGETLELHGLLSVDYFSVLKTVRTQAGTWRAVSSWTPVEFPLAMVVFGKAIPSP